jgi:hypothetical protein
MIKEKSNRWTYKEKAKLKKIMRGPGTIVERYELAM